jgi:hypothetical protein
MFLEERLVMNVFINKKIDLWLDRYPKLKQWLWFIVLWNLGLFTTITLTYPIKMLIHFIK